MQGCWVQVWFCTLNLSLKDPQIPSISMLDQILYSLATRWDLDTNSATSAPTSTGHSLLTLEPLRLTERRDGPNGPSQGRHLTWTAWSTLISCKQACSHFNLSTLALGRLQRACSVSWTKAVDPNLLVTAYTGSLSNSLSFSPVAYLSDGNKVQLGFWMNQRGNWVRLLTSIVLGLSI